MPNEKQLEPEYATQIKKILRENAASRQLDLDVPANRFTVWYQNGAQGYLCKGSGENRAAAWEIIGRYQMSDAVIFDAVEDRITVLTCKAG